MAAYIRVVEDESDPEVIELPVEPDGTMLLSTLTAQFPCASGLKYRNPGTRSLRGLRVVEGRIQPPDDVWGDHLYIAVFPKDNKRKGEDSSENNSAKTRRVENKTVDLIVLGLAWKTTVASMREYFEKNFGEVLMCEIKKNLENQSKGFGFVRFKDYKVQCSVVSQRHNIDGRYCDVKVPDSKNSQDSKKMFVGRMPQDMTKEDLYNYFTKYGEVTDVYIPKPYRCFGFVTFLRSDVATVVASEDHIYKGTSLQVNRAEPKNPKMRMQGDGDHHQGGYGYVDRGGYSDQGRYYTRGDYAQRGRGRGGGKIGARGGDNYRDRDQAGGPSWCSEWR